MPEYVNSFTPLLLGAVFVSLATVTIAFDGLARADDVCIEQLPQPVAEAVPESAPYRYPACHSCHATAATEVLRWSVRHDPVKGRKCWFLLDFRGRDVTKAHVRRSAAPAPGATPAPTAAPAPSAAPAPAPSVPPATLSSKIASLFGNFNFMGTSANAAAENEAPPVSPHQISPPNSPRKPEGDSANVKKTDGAVQTAQKSVGKGQKEKRVSQVKDPREERRALFEEFLQWREYEEMFKRRP